MTIFKTFKDFLKTDPTEGIQEKCRPFIEQSKGLPLYRGYGNKVGSLVKGAREIDIRKNRKPRDSSQLVHDLMDRYFHKKFGVNVRSEGLFAIGNKKRSERYGAPYYVLPIGEFKYVWGSLNGRTVADTMSFANEIKEIQQSQPSSEGDAITSYVLDRIDWHTDDLHNAIAYDAEIALLCDKAILIPVGDVDYEKLIGG